MAQIKKIVRSNPISNFQQVAPDGGATFRVLAEGLNTLYERTAPVALEQQTQEGLEWGRRRGREMVADDGGNGAAPADTAALIREFEGFRESPYWDVNAHRLGFGSDTVTLPDGSVKKVQEGDRVSREDAERDLQRRISTEFEPIARRAIGDDRFNSMSPSQRAAVTSIAYNYGEIPSRIVGALQSGDAGAAASAIRALGQDNDGINEKRRNREADIFLSGADEGAGVMMRSPDGSTQMRKYSPYAGPILQAHDAAARVAVQAEVLNSASADLENLSRQYELDAEGYTEAAQAYIDQLVETVPDEIRGDIGQTLSTEAHRARLGIKDAQHRDTRARANNASRALVDRWSTGYAEALASGDPTEIDAAQRKLDNILQAREALPGVAWTPEQSANVFLDAESAAQTILQQRKTSESNQIKETISLITKAAKAGKQADGEEILQNPGAVSQHPKLAREAAAYVALRDNSPGFLSLTPGQQAEEIAKLEAQPVGEEWQIDIAEAARKMARENRKAWDDDPVKRAGEVLQTPPPPLPELTPEDPGKFVEGLAARREYMNDVRSAGYTETQAYLSEEEAQQMGVLMSKGTDPAIRAAMSGAIVAGFGPDAVRVFDEIGGDRVTMFAGKIQAVGGRPEVAQAILQGQQMLSENLVQLPPKSDRMASFNSQIATAFQGISGGIEAQGEVMEAAQALYASKAQGIDPSSSAANDLMAQSVQTVLGQSKNKRGDLTGGVQPVMGHQTLLPVGVPGKKVEETLRTALGGSPERVSDIPGRIMQGLTNLGRTALGDDLTVEAENVWSDAGVNGVPSISGKPIPRRYVDNDMVRPVSIGGNLYRLEMTNGASKLDVEDGNGNVLVFDMVKLMEAAE